ncbi:MAG: AMP-binding protein, partial [Acidobacteriota bacterium]
MLDTIVYSSSNERPNEPAAIDANGISTWHDIAVQTDRFIVELKQLDLGHQAILMLPQQSSVISLLAACAAIRLNTILISTFFGETGARELMEELGAQSLLTIQNNKVVQLAAKNTSKTSSNELNEPFIAILTSGTTGRPKCASHTWTTLAGV